MKKVRITNSWFDVNGHGISYEVFKGGELYDVTPETERQVALQNGEVVDVPDEPAPEAAEASVEAAPEAAAAEAQPEAPAESVAAPAPAAGKGKKA